MNDNTDFDPTDADLAEVEDVDFDLSDLSDQNDSAEDVFDFDDDYAPRDDRWSEGVPSWSAWA